MFSIIERRPAGGLDGILADINRMGLGAHVATRRREAFSPAVDAIGTRDGVIIRADLPGLSADEIEISADADGITISGERRGPVAEDGRRWLLRESRHGAFSRRVTLPEWAERGAIKASYRDGVLEISVPMRKGSGPLRVPIEAAQ